SSPTVVRKRPRRPTESCTAPPRLGVPSLASDAPVRSRSVRRFVGRSGGASASGYQQRRPSPRCLSRFLDRLTPLPIPGDLRQRQEDRLPLADYLVLLPP